MKKLIKQKNRIVALLLIAIFIISVANIKVEAANNTSTQWKKGSYTVGTMDITNNNLTPVKTIMSSGTLSVWVRFDKRLDDPNYPPIVVKVQIRDASTGKVLESFNVLEKDKGWNVLARNINVKANQKIQVFFDVCSQYSPPGPYRKARVTYGYSLS